MNPDNIALMRRAKAQLAAHWLPAVIATLIYGVIMGVASSTAVAELIVSGPMSFGYVLYMGCLVDTRQDRLELLFRGFSRFVDTLIAGLLISVAVSVGAALLIVPGIILACGFSMTFFIMADDANISGLDAMKMSWHMMEGHKMQLFMLWLNFIGWFLLSIITCGIGFLWLTPYVTVATLNFYRSLRYGTF